MAELSGAILAFVGGGVECPAKVLLSKKDKDVCATSGKNCVYN